MLTSFAPNVPPTVSGPSGGVNARPLMIVRSPMTGLVCTTPGGPMITLPAAADRKTLPAAPVAVISDADTSRLPPVTTSDTPPELAVKSVVGENVVPVVTETSYLPAPAPATS